LAGPVTITSSPVDIDRGDPDRIAQGDKFKDDFPTRERIALGHQAIFAAACSR
jgi:hypothetical protein